MSRICAITGKRPVKAEELSEKVLPRKVVGLVLAWLKTPRDALSQTYNVSALSYHQVKLNACGYL